MSQPGSAREPHPLALLAVTVAAVVVCIAAAWWQWQRAHRTEADAVPDAPVVALADVDPMSAYSGMRVAFSGTFDPAHELLVVPRDRDGAPGAWVLTPLQPEPAGSVAVAVLRGWVPAGTRPAAPPSGPVAVEAVLVADERSVDPVVVPGDPPTTAVVDTGALAAHAGYPVRSGWFALRELAPSAPGQPAPLQVTELPGAEVGLNWRNAAYAVQWIAFAGFALMFWVRFRRDIVNRSKGSLT